MNLKNMTNTEARLKKALSKANNITGSVDDKISDAFDESVIQIGYPIKYLVDEDIVYCQLKNDIVHCKPLHSAGGSLSLFFTPEGDYQFNVEKQQVELVPRDSNLRALLLRINNPRYEYALIGYLNYNDEHIPTPALTNGVKLVNTGAVDDFYIEFTNGGLTANLNSLDIKIGGNGNFKPVFTDLINKVIKLEDKVKGLTTEVHSEINDVNERVDNIEDYLFRLLEQRITTLEKKVKKIEEELEPLPAYLKNMNSRIKKLEEGI